MVPLQFLYFVIVDIHCCILCYHVCALLFFLLLFEECPRQAEACFLHICGHFIYLFILLNHVHSCALPLEFETTILGEVSCVYPVFLYLPSVCFENFVMLIFVRAIVIHRLHKLASLLLFSYLLQSTVFLICFCDSFMIVCKCEYVCVCV